MSSRQSWVIIDDGASMSQAIERLLAAAGWKVRSFASADDFLASGPTAAVLPPDVQLPGLSGQDPDVAAPGRGQRAAGDFHVHPGPSGCPRAAAWFAKPFEGSALIRVIRQHLPTAPFPTP